MKTGSRQKRSPLRKPQREVRNLPPEAAPCAAEYGEFAVRIEGCAASHELPGVAHRRLRLTHSPSGDARRVEHYHFFEWDDHGVPEHPRC